MGQIHRLLAFSTIFVWIGLPKAFCENSAEELVHKAKVAYRQNLQYDTARYLFQKACDVYEAKQKPDKQAEVLYNMSMTYYIQSNYADALKFALKAKSLMTNDIPCKIKLNNDLSIGRIKYAMNYKEEALEYVQSLLGEIRSCNNSNVISQSINYIAVVNYELGRIDTAELYLYQSLALAQQDKDTAAASQVHSILGELYLWHRKDHYKSLYHINEGLKLAKELGDVNATAFAHIKKAMYYIEIGSPDLSFAHLDTAETKFRNMGSLVDVIYARHNRADAHKKLGNADSVHLIWQGIYQLYDTIFKREKRDDLVKYQTQYETQEKERDNLILTIKNEKQKRKNNFLLLSSALLFFVIVAFGIWRIGVMKNRQLVEKSELQRSSYKSIIEAEEKERVRIAKDLHDGLGQILSTAKLNIASLEDGIEFEDRKLYDNSVSLIDQAVREVRTVSHDLMPGALIQLGLVAAISQLIEKINDTQKLVVQLTDKLKNDRLPPAIEIGAYRVVQEVLNNMIKHAEASLIDVQIVQSDTELNICVIDDGKGFDTQSIDTFKGIGWRNIQSRIQMLNGTLEVYSEIASGTKVNFVLPIT